MKDYLSNSSINLSNVSDENYTKHQHFTSSNKMMGSKLDQAIPYGMIAKERKDTIEKNRQRHIWMGRDNEFKRLASKQQSQVPLNVESSSKNHNRELADRLRSHNFNFGYTDKTELEKARIKNI